MDIHRFPEALRDLAALDARLEEGNFSVDELDKITESAANCLRMQRVAPKKDLRGRAVPREGDAVETLALQILDKAAGAREAVIQSDVALLPRIGALETKVMAIWLAKGEPEEVAEKLNEMGAELHALEQQSIGSSEVQAKLREVKEKVESAIFAFVFPIVEELGMRPGSFAYNITVEG